MEEEKKDIPKEYLDHAEYLIERGYVDEKDVEKLAEKIYENSEKN